MSADDKARAFRVFLWQNWRDEYLMWTPASHGGITRLNFNTGPDAQIWTPDIVVFSASVYPFILALHACGPQDAKKI